MYLEDSQAQHHRADHGMGLAKRPKEGSGTSPHHIVYLLTFAFAYALCEVWPKPSRSPVPGTNLNGWHLASVDWPIEREE